MRNEEIQNEEMCTVFCKPGWFIYETFMTPLCSHTPPARLHGWQQLELHTLLQSIKFHLLLPLPCINLTLSNHKVLGYISLLLCSHSETLLQNWIEKLSMPKTAVLTMIFIVLQAGTSAIIVFWKASHHREDSLLASNQVGLLFNLRWTKHTHSLFLVWHTLRHW